MGSAEKSPAAQIWNMTWQEVGQACRDLVEEILENQKSYQKVETIVCVAKGGMIPAGIIWQHFPKAEMVMLRVSSYDECGNKNGQVRILNPQVLVHLHSPSSILVVDDICDSGDTFRKVEEYLPGAQYAPMLLREKCSFKPTYSKWRAPTPGWVQFPWEPSTEETPLPF